MKKVTNFVVNAFIIILFSASLFAQDNNMLTNWEFDNGLDGWQFWDGGADADAIYQVDDTGILSGDYSLRWEIINGGSEVWYLQTYQTVPVYEGIEYFIDFLIAWDGPSELVLSFVWELAVDPYTKYLTVDTLLYDFNQRIQYSFIAEATDETANFKIFVGKNVDAFVWLDKIYLSDVPLEESAVADQHAIIPSTLSLLQNFPNPFNAATTFSFDLPETQAVKVEIVDVHGRSLQVHDLGMQSAGQHDFHFDASDLTSGIYFYRVKTNTGLSQTRRCVLLK